MTGPAFIGGRGVRVACVLSFLLLLWGTATTGAQEATPPAAGGASGLNAMLAHVPVDLPELESPDQAIVAYADIAAQLAAVGVEAPASVEAEGFGEWRPATTGMALPSLPAQFFQEFRDDFGFDLLQAEQTLEINAPPFNLTLYRGQFDEAAVLAALEELGYRPGGVEGRRVLSVRGDFEFDLGGPADYMLSAMNYMTILDDGTLVFAPARSIMAAVIAVDTGDEPSLVEDEGVATLLSHAPADLVSALLVPGTQLAGGLPLDIFLPQPGATPDMDAMATRMAEQAQMPRVILALLGETAGGPIPQLNLMTPEAESESDDTTSGRAVVVLLMPGPAAAEDAAPIIEERLATGSTMSDRRPFTEFFPDPTVTAVPDDAVVVIDLPFGETHRGILRNLLYARDLGFLAWG